MVRVPSVYFHAFGCQKTLSLHQTQSQVIVSKIHAITISKKGKVCYNLHKVTDFFDSSK